jgi:hypothetical protein
MKYLIHDNGGRPFTVELKKKTNGKYNVVVWKNRYEGDDYKPIPDEEIYHINNVEAFVGKHPKEYDFTQGEDLGKEFHGNSILLGLGRNKYIYIGWKIFEFESLSKIVKFYSPVGNSDVPYSFAIDEDSNCYLLIENIIMYDYKLKDDPYYFYYKQERPKNASKINLVQKTKNGTKKITARFDPGIELWHRYDFFRKDNGKKITKAEYIKKMEKAATALGVGIIQTNMIHGRV